MTNKQDQPRIRLCIGKFQGKHSQNDTYQSGNTTIRKTFVFSDWFCFDIIRTTMDSKVFESKKSSTLHNNSKRRIIMSSSPSSSSSSKVIVQRSLHEESEYVVSLTLGLKFISQSVAIEIGSKDPTSPAVQHLCHAIEQQVRKLENRIQRSGRFTQKLISNSLLSVYILIATGHRTGSGKCSSWLECNSSGRKTS